MKSPSWQDSKFALLPFVGRAVGEGLGTPYAFVARKAYMSSGVSVNNSSSDEQYVQG
jgi:hypothetical protein